VDLQTLVTLQGNTHPLARPEFDQGAAPDSLPMERILLVLQRSAEQEAALRTLLDEQQIKSSPSYHMWLTPEQFGEQFGPADADIQAVTDWLTSQGFTVNRVAAGRTVIEFTGTAGTVRQGFHTEIHKYLVKGQEHWGNASDPQIPAALAPVVAGFASLNNFPRKPMVERAGVFSRSKATGEVKPLMTGSSGSYYALGPTDFATIYNVLPLWSAGTDGTGQTIAIVAGSNINISDVENFRTLFGLPAKDPQIIVNGVDPGVTMTDGETEADLDTEWSGAVAKNATIVLVVSEDTESTYGADLSAVYIVDNNLAPILSASYGVCEAALGVGGNAFYNALWGQGAAQGITILVASGDEGSAGCDVYSGEVAAEYGLMVSGTASTPYNVAVGGTDFNDVDTWSKYWSSTNNTSTLASALSYIPETTWNDSCARTGVASNCASAESDTPTGIDLVGGGGGASNCVNSTSTSTTLTCMGGYPKPAWQSGNGVPSDGARDLPDVSLFAADGTIAKSFYVVCEADALPAGYPSCNQSYSEWYFLPVGGTSASTPTFAGLMALVNQAAGGRRGNANYVLYPMAAKSGASCTSDASMASTANNSACIFYDVVAGNNSVACTGGSPNCSNTISGGYGILEVNPPSNSSPAWTTTAGYDLATGLGSVNAANLAKNWSSISFQPSTTTLASLSPTNLTHGQTVNFTVNVAPGSGSGALTGNVSLIAQTGVSPTNVTGIGPFALSSGSFSGSSNMLPGGTYGVTAHYPGNGTYGASDSTPPVQVTVSPEGSLTHVALLTFNPTTGQETSSNATSLVYGSSFEILRVDVTNSSGQDCSPISQYSCPTGQVTPTDNGQPLDLGTYKLNSQGFTEDQFTQLAGGQHKVVASYGGDNSYTSSTSLTDAVTVTPAPTTTTLTGVPSSSVGGSVSFVATITTQSCGAAPTGTVQALNNGVPLPTLYSISGSPYSPSTGAYATGSAPISLTLPLGSDSVTVQYSGDTNYAGSTSAATTVTVTDFSLSANPAGINISAPGQSGTSTISATPLGGFTGAVSLSCSTTQDSLTCTITPNPLNVTGASSATATLTVNSTAQVSATLRGTRRRAPPSFPLPFAVFWILSASLALAICVRLAVAGRRRVGWLFAGAVLILGFWAACGGGSGGGGGGSPPPYSAPQVSLSPTSLTFGPENTGFTSAPQTVTLSNTGNALLSISSIAIQGLDWLDYAQTNNCGAGVSAGANCAIAVTFTPTHPFESTSTASLAISDNVDGSPQTVNLKGTVLPPPTQPGTYGVSVLAQSGNDSKVLSVTVTVQ
jgi:subtilase family serine protease